MFSLFRNRRRSETAAPELSREADDFNRLVAPAWGFLSLVNERFPERERLRDRSHLDADYDEIALALVRLFVVRDDLRPDVRELMMRLATFQELPEDVRHLAIPLVFPPSSDKERQLNDMVARARVAVWQTLDRLEQEHPGGPTCADKGELGLLITGDDLGWRPQSPQDVLHTNSNGGMADA